MPTDDTRQSISTERALKWTVFLGAAALIVYLCLRILQPFFGVLAWAIVLATIFHPLYRWLTRRTNRPAPSKISTPVGRRHASSRSSRGRTRRV